MGKHRSYAPNGARIVSPQLEKGRHRAPTTTGRTVARVAVAGVVAGVPVTAGFPASASESTVRIDRVAVSAPAQGFNASALTTSGGFDRDAIIQCESGGVANAQNPTSSASGLYQFIDSTWRAYRGGSSAARAKDASVAEQHAAAARLFAAEGYTPWNASRSCWGSKIGSGSRVAIQDNAPRQESAPRQDNAPQQQSAPQRQSAPAQSTGDKYTVKPGDTLGKIAAQLHGDKSKWRDLYERNRDVVGSNPHLIFPGQELVK